MTTCTHESGVTFNGCIFCHLSEKDQEIARLKEAVDREHELYLTAHRDNMKGASLLMERNKEIARLRDKIRQYELVLDPGANFWTELIDRAEKAEARVKELEAELEDEQVDNNSLRRELAAEKEARETAVRVIESWKKEEEIQAAIMGDIWNALGGRDAHQDGKNVIEIAKRTYAANAALSSENSALRETMKKFRHHCVECHDVECHDSDPARHDRIMSQYDKVLATPPTHWQKVAEAKQNVIEAAKKIPPNSEEPYNGTVTVLYSSWENLRKALSALADLEGKNG